MVPFLSLARTGWFVQLPIIGGLNEPLFLVSPCRAHIRSAHARLRELRRLHRFFLMGAATPPLPRRGVFAPKTRANVQTPRRGHRPRLQSISILVCEPTYFANGSGLTWNFTSLLVFPLPPSAWNGARVAKVV